MIYGTAWKEGKTKELVKQAVRAGFRAIDTANQKKHYREDFVGEALLDLAQEGFTRESLFLQSKFTYVDGQDHRLPYDPNSSFTEQVYSSFESTLKQLHTNYIDSYLLHGPSSGRTWTDADWETWLAMEEIQKSGKAKCIGVSNVSVVHLNTLLKEAKVKPSFVQNRCYAAMGWDHEVRTLCLENGITYQGFSLLTANPRVLSNSQFLDLAAKKSVSVEALVFRFTISIGILPLTGTTDPAHMTEDLLSPSIPLSAEETRLLVMGLR